MSLRTVRRPCALCGNTDATLLWRGREHEYPDTTDETFAVVKCDTCGLGRLDPCPDVSELDTIYPPAYYSYNMVSGRGTDGEIGLKEKVSQRYAASVLETALERAAVTAGDKVKLLDVGCGDGRILDYYRAARPDLETWGLDINGDALAIAAKAGHKTVQGAFEKDVELPKGYFDVVIARHVIEHVEDPVVFARNAAALLRPGGVFLAACPDFGSADAKRFRGHWGGNHFPRHWWFFDGDAMRKVAEHVGLECVAIDHELNPVFWTWTMHSALKDRYPTAKWVDAVFPPVSIFYGGPRSFLLQGTFSVVDSVFRKRTGMTGSMLATLRKPTSNS
ncbi:MAG TPA: class I SAM-dependent methyltransferase [Mycobacteriales bacterium]|nr:class I SAM-dependent methyltransferase [Mycobacteriales bacterium]